MLTIDCWYRTREDRFVQITDHDETLGVFVGQCDAQELYYNAEGKAYCFSESALQANRPGGALLVEMPDICWLRSLEPIPPPPVHTYRLYVKIKASVLMRGVSSREVMALAPDMLDVVPLANDIQVGELDIKVVSGYVIQSGEA